jgi:DNA-binding transcriptional regulator YdaS (Cro superfamily)
MEQLKAWIDGERGRLTMLAEKCAITHSAICQWTRVPIERVAVVERVTGIPRTQLRPDIYEAA